MKGKYLITTTQWFYAPDGKVYRCVWGDVEILSDGILGVKTNHHSANWFAKIGSESNHMVVAGCQIHYAIRCEEKPNTEGTVENWSADSASGIKIYNEPIRIYIAE